MEDTPASSSAQAAGSMLACRKRLLILDVNGLLLDTRHRRSGPGELPRRQPDGHANNFLVYKRPYCVEFARFCLDTFTVGVWSSARLYNVKALVEHVFGEEQHRLAFIWSQSECTDTGLKHPDNRFKPIFLKELAKVWNPTHSCKPDRLDAGDAGRPEEVVEDGDREEESMPWRKRRKRGIMEGYHNDSGGFSAGAWGQQAEGTPAELPWSKGVYGPWNTLLLDDSPYKAAKNPLFTAVFPEPYDAGTTVDDTALGVGGALRSYLERLGEWEGDVPAFVRINPFGLPPVRLLPDGRLLPVPRETAIEEKGGVGDEVSGKRWREEEDGDKWVHKRLKGEGAREFALSVVDAGVTVVKSPVDVPTPSDADAGSSPTAGAGKEAVAVPAAATAAAAHILCVVGEQDHSSRHGVSLAMGSPGAGDGVGIERLASALKHDAELETEEVAQSSFSRAEMEGAMKVQSAQNAESLHKGDFKRKEEQQAPQSCKVHALDQVDHGWVRSAQMRTADLPRSDTGFERERTWRVEDFQSVNGRHAGWARTPPGPRRWSDFNEPARSPWASPHRSFHPTPQSVPPTGWGRQIYGQTPAAPSVLPGQQLLPVPWQAGLNPYQQFPGLVREAVRGRIGRDQPQPQLLQHQQLRWIVPGSWPTWQERNQDFPSSPQQNRLKDGSDKYRPRDC